MYSENNVVFVLFLKTQNHFIGNPYFLHLHFPLTPTTYFTYICICVAVEVVQNMCSIRRIPSSVICLNTYDLLLPLSSTLMLAG